MAGILPEKFQAFMRGEISRDEAEGNASKPTLSSIINTPSKPTYTPTPYSQGNNYGGNSSSSSSSSNSSPSAILQLKDAYESRKAAGASQSELDGIHNQAETLRSQLNISNNDTKYGNAPSVAYNTNTGSSYTSPAPNYTTPSTPSYSAPATSYTGSANIIGNVSGSTDLGKSYQEILNVNRTGDQQYKQLNTWADNKGNVYDTTNMSAQQAYALMLAKSGNSNATAILKGMGLDMNGNPTSPTPTYSSSTSGNTGWNPKAGVPDSGQSSALRDAYDSRNNSYTSAPGPAVQTGQAVPNPSSGSWGGNTHYNPTGQQLDGYGFGYNPDRPTKVMDRDFSSYGGQQNSGSGQPKSAADLIKSIYDANYSSQSQKLKSARDQALAGLAGQDDIVNQNAVKDLNSNDVMANQRMQALKEAMANMGLNSSGDNVSAQIGIGTSQQQGANDINTNKGNLLKNLLAQRNAINNNASADDLSLMQSLQATRDSQLLNQSNADRSFNYNAGQDAIRNGQWQQQFGLQSQGQQFNQDLAGKQYGLQSQGQNFNQDVTKAGLTGVYNGQQTQQAQNQQFNQGVTLAGLTGNYDPYASQKQQMAANSAAWFNASPADRLKLAADNQRIGASIGARQDANGDWVYPQAQRTIQGQQFDAQDAQRQWDNEFKEGQFTYQKAQQLWENTFKEKTFDQSVKQFAANLGADYAKMNQSAQQFTAEMAYKQKALDLQSDKLNNPSSGNFNIDDYKSYINQNYYKTDPMTNAKSFDQGSAERYILNLNIPSTQKAQLYQLYNIPLK